MNAPVEGYVIVAGILFFIGIVGVIARRNPLIQLMSIELLFNSANLALVTFARSWGNNAGHIFAFLVITVAAAEAAIGLAIVVIVFRKTTFVDVEGCTLKGYHDFPLLFLIWLPCSAPFCLRAAAEAGRTGSARDHCSSRSSRHWGTRRPAGRISALRVAAAVRFGRSGTGFARLDVDHHRRRLLIRVYRSATWLRESLRAVPSPT